MTAEPEVDGSRPRAVERPLKAEAVARLLAQSAGAGRAVIPIGGGRALGMGDPPTAFDVALDTRGLNRIVELSQADLTATVEAGVTLEELNEELGRAGQFLPLDPFGSPGHTVGGVLAAGWSGPLRLGYGTAREFVIGLRVALPDGRLVRSGGRVVKNVSGYDLNKLHLGAMGSLGVIVEASFKVFPRPLSRISLGTTVDSVETAWSETRRLLGMALRPIALTVWAASDARYWLHASLAGSPRAVERIAGEVGWPRLAEDPPLPASGTWARISVPPGRLAAVLGTVARADRWIALPGVGVAHWLDAKDAAAIGRVRQAAEAAGGSVVLMAAPPELKRATGAWGSPPPNLELMRRLKDAFDPRRVLSPGRYVV